MIFHVICITITIIITAGSSKTEGYNVNIIQFFIYLAAAFILLYALRRRRLFVYWVIIIEYFILLMFPYSAPHYAFLEFLWMPGIILLFSILKPMVITLLLTAVLGVPGCIFLSYNYFSGAVFRLGENTCTYGLAALFFYVPVTAFAVLAGCFRIYAGRLKDEKEGLEQLKVQLSKINKEISNKIFRLQNEIASEERKKISREIHDAAGYMFANLIMMLQAALAVLEKDKEKAKIMIRDARNYSERGMNEIRHILHNIYEYKHNFFSLQNSLFDLTESFRKTTNITLTTEYGNWPPSFSETLNSFLLSFAQECLTNALKHGQPSMITIMCWKTGPMVFIRVADNGKGAVMPLKKGIGISSMENFVYSTGGSVNIKSDGNGFRITIGIDTEKENLKDAYFNS
jgi:signal transduction histidine kinase